MGNCDSATSAELARQNKKINASIEVDKKNQDSTIKLLLLGAGESGKSTILKQMKIIHNNGFTAEEQNSSREVVRANVIQCMGALCEGMVKLKIPFENSEMELHAAYVAKVLQSNQEHSEIHEMMFTAIEELWKDEGVQRAFRKKDEFYLHDSALYFFENLQRIRDLNYLPTEKDILHTRIATMGVIEVTFMMKNKLWRVFDVGGQRSQRKKWIHCFDDVKALIYVASLSEYDQVLMEDNKTNRMEESLQLFKQLINNKYFLQTAVILFLNKKDLFEQKIGKGHSLKMAFPEYKGAETYEDATKYIQRKYISSNVNPDKMIYTHYTCATDTTQVQFVLDSVLDTILSTKLKGCGLY